MRALFLVTSFWAYGELLIAMRFAQELRKKGNEVFFILPPTHKQNIKGWGFRYVSLVPGFREMNRILFAEVQQLFKPDIVILSDFLNYTFADKHYGLRREDLDVFAGKLATFDNFNWKMKRRCMDTYGFVSDIPRKADITLYGELIQPCPLLNHRNADRRNHTYALIGETLDISVKRKTELRRKHGIAENKKVILVSYAKWQENCIDNEQVNGFIRLSNQLFDDLIVRLSFYHIIICIGKEKRSFPIRDNIYTYPSMPAVQFNEYAALADAYIGRNMSSTSMIQLALSNVPCFNLVNSYVKQEPLEGRTGVKPYKYMMFPVGWYYFLSPLFEDSPYGDIIIRLEQFQPEMAVESICALLDSKEKREELSDRTAVLNGELNTLPKPEEIIADIING